MTFIDTAHVRLEGARGRLLTVSSLGEMVDVLRETARAVAGSDGIAVVLRDGGSCHYVAEDAIRPLWRGRRFPLEACISGWAMLNDRTAVIPDIESDPRVPVAAYRAASMRSLVMTPIGSPAPVAALGAYWCAYVEPGEEAVRRLQMLAAMATAALNRLRRPAPVPAAGLTIDA